MQYPIGINGYILALTENTNGLFKYQYKKYFWDKWTNNEITNMVIDLIRSNLCNLFHNDALVMSMVNNSSKKKKKL